MALKDEQGYTLGLGRVFMKLAVTDTAYGAMTFYWSDSYFSATNALGGPAVYAPVLAWGSLRKFLSLDGEQRTSECVIEFDALATVVPSGGTTRFTFLQLVTEVNLRDSKVEFYQWNASSTTQEVIWTGYWDGVEEYLDRDSYPTMTVRFKPRLVTQELPVSDVVSTASFADAPYESVGQMVPRTYGEFRTYTHGEADYHRAFTMGYPLVGAPGVAIARSDSSGYISLKVRFSKNDGSTAAGSFVEGTNDTFDTQSDIYLFDDMAGAPVKLNPLEIVAATNDTAKCEADVKLYASGYMALRPSDKTSNNQFANLYKMIDDNASNYETSTDAIYKLEMYCPQLTGGLLGTVVEAQIAVDVENVSGASRAWKIAFMNTNTNTEIKSSTGTLAAGGGRRLEILAYANALVANDIGFADNSGNIVSPDFNSGQLLTRGATGVTYPLAMKFELTGGSGNRADVKVYGITLIFKVYMTLVKRLRPLGDPNYPSYITPGVLERQFQSGYMKRGDYAVTPDLRFFATGLYQLDDGSGTYTGTASKAVRELPDIIYHLFGKVLGESVNTTSGTLGNIPDARDAATGLGNYEYVFISFGPNVTKAYDAIGILEKHFPVRILNEDSHWNVIPDVPNPHSSRFYRSTSDLVRIGAADIVTGSLRCYEPSYDDIENNVELRFGHAFGSGRPQGTIADTNPLSIRYFGTRELRSYDNPYVGRNSRLTGAGSPYEVDADSYATYLAWRNSRPRLTVEVSLAQKFYDLKRGHVIEFDSTVDAILPCPAFRCGRLDYAHFRADAGPGADQSDDTTPTYTPNSVASETYFGASYQFGRLNFSLGSAAGSYTTVANGWEYYNGSSWVALTGVARSDGGDPLTVFMQSGSLSVSWTRPSPELWKKSELTLVSTVVGPCYWVRMKYTTPNLGGTAGDGLTTLPVTWAGRLFEVIEATRKPGVAGDYPSMDVVLREVM